MVQSLDLRYRTAAESDQDRANAIFSGAVLVYRSLPAMHALVGCLREITLREIGLNDPAQQNRCWDPENSDAALAAFAKLLEKIST